MASRLGGRQADAQSRVPEQHQLLAAQLGLQRLFAHLVAQGCSRSRAGKSQAEQGKGWRAGSAAKGRQCAARAPSLSLPAPHLLPSMHTVTRPTTRPARKATSLPTNYIHPPTRTPSCLQAHPPTLTCRIPHVLEVALAVLQLLGALGDKGSCREGRYLGAAAGAMCWVQECGGGRKVRAVSTADEGSVEDRLASGWPVICRQQKGGRLRRSRGAEANLSFLPPVVSGWHPPWSLSGPGGCVSRRRSRGGAGTAELAPVALVAGRWIVGGAATTWGIEGASESETDDVATAVKAAVCRKGGDGGRLRERGIHACMREVRVARQCA